MFPISACPGVPWAEIVAILVRSLSFQGMSEEGEARSYIRMPDVNDDQVRCFSSPPILLESRELGRQSVTRARSSTVRSSGLLITQKKDLTNVLCAWRQPIIGASQASYRPQ